MPHFLIYGTFMRGQPGHSNLQGARFVGPVQTAAHYRLWHIDGCWPALILADDGVAIEAELYDMAPDHLTRLAEIEPPGWGRAPVELADGRVVDAFLGNPDLQPRGVDVSADGGWAETINRGRGS